ncbi:MAG: hypothetical protein ABSE64_15510 [Vulcanimicrobiaceae bacterium]|jgi:hypothetical protein
MPSTNVVLTPVIYSDIFGEPASLEKLVEFVRVPNWKLVGTRCIGIAALSWQHGIEDPEHQARLFREFGYPLLYGPGIASIMQDPRRRLYTRESLLAILRIAAVNEVAPGTLLSDLEFADVFHKAVLAANELVTNELNPENPVHGAKDFLATELRSILAQQQNPHDLIARTAAFFEWSESARATEYLGELRPRSDFESFTSLTPEKFAAATYLTLARAANMRTWNDVLQQGAGFDPETWLSTQGITDKTVMQAWLSRHTVSISQARGAWSKESSLSFAGAGPIWKTPLVADDLSFMPSPFFVANMLGDGAYFELFDGYGKRNTQFSTLYGHFFQHYVEDRFRSGYAGRADAELWADVPFSGGRSTDVIVAEDGSAIFIEVVAKRMQLVGSVLKLDEYVIVEDLRLGVIEKLEQLRDNIAAFRARNLLPGVPRLEGQKIYPVLVAPNEWPRIYLILHLLEQEPYKSLLADCEPIEFLDVGEVEVLEAQLKLGLKFAHLLDRKNRTTTRNRSLSMHNYLTVVEPGTYPIARSPMREKGGDVARALIELAKGWSS